MRRALLLFMVLAACAQPAARADGGASAVAPADTLPHRFTRTLVGTAGDERVEARIRREDESLNGTWRGGTGELWFTGTVAAGGVVAIELAGEEGAPAGTLTGTLSAGPEGLALRGRLAAPGAEPREVALAEERAVLGPGIGIVPRTWIDEDAERGWSIHAEVPEVVAAVGATLGPEHRAFNALVDSLIKADAEPFRAAALENEPPPDLDVGSFYETAYEVTLAEGGLASFAFDVSAYLAGAAHPNHGTWTLTWDFDAGRPITLDMLFLPGSAYLDTLSDFAIPVLVGDLGEYAETAWIEDGAGPTAENYARWTLVADGLRVAFDPYQVAPYAAGPQEVVVPWSALEPLLDPSGPVVRISR